MKKLLFIIGLIVLTIILSCEKDKRCKICTTEITYWADEKTIIFQNIFEACEDYIDNSYSFKIHGELFLSQTKCK